MALLRYTFLRALILIVVGALLWLVGFRGFWLLLAAVFCSGIMSIFILRRSRDAASTALDRRVSTIRHRLAERTVAEDVWDEERRTLGEQASAGSPSAPDNSSETPGRG
ncbi:DUF4229 domain-containing protein [Phytoactinopolyspora limicola]|uniref:DUF4229 domain-containing protein n=1 Tax=Phytoactinopolyspora limicola TaxID=2715536 RepID=UPI001407BB36|nr:DUF4229 domain-containing protein [Phytoactinopolyspora limicola]